MLCIFVCMLCAMHPACSICLGSVSIMCFCVSPLFAAAGRARESLHVSATGCLRMQALCMPVLKHLLYSGSFYRCYRLLMVLANRDMLHVNACAMAKQASGGNLVPAHPLRFLFYRSKPQKVGKNRGFPRGREYHSRNVVSNCE